MLEFYSKIPCHRRKVAKIITFWGINPRLAGLGGRGWHAE
jgi:hypothetical protein